MEYANGAGPNCPDRTNENQSPAPEIVFAKAPSGSKHGFPIVVWLMFLLLFVTGSAVLAVLSDFLAERWQNRPRPGAQVRQQYVATQGEGADALARQINYLLYLPKDYYEGRQWPMVVVLHGAGNPETEVRLHGPPHLVDGGKQFDFILLSPECPDSRWDPETVVSLIEHVSNSLSVDRDRVCLTGISAGGRATWDVACYDPGRFAAIAPLCSGGDVTKASRLKNVPVWAFYGGIDKPEVIEASTAMVDAVKKCGGRVKVTVYPKNAHDVWAPAYNDPQLYEWFLAQWRVRPLKPSVAAEEKSTPRKTDTGEK